MKTAIDSNPGGDPPRRKNFRVLNGGDAPEPRVLPHSVEAEQYVLSALMLDGANEVPRSQRVRLKPSHFYVSAHGVVFEAILALFTAQQPTDVACVAEWLKRAGKFDQLGGMEFLMQVSSLVPTTAQAGYHLQVVVETAILRRIIRDGTGLVEDCYSYSGDIAAFTTKAAEKLQSIANFAASLDRRVSQRDAAAAAREDALLVAAGKIDKSRWLHFPLAKMDREFMPLDTRLEDWLITLAAPPSGGKSTAMRWLAGEWLYGGKRGVVFLLETSRKLWLQRLAASFAEINLRDLEDIARLFPQKFELFTRWMEVIEDWMEERLWIFEDVFAVEDIVRTIRLVDKTLRDRETAAGVEADKVRGLDFVIGDYIQIASTRRQFLKRTEELGHIVRSLKECHRSLNVPGIWGAQITREARAEARRPNLGDLGESKALEEASDRVLFIHVPPMEDGNPQDGSVVDVEFIQRKSRNGPKDVALPMEFNKPLGTFGDTSRKQFPSDGGGDEPPAGPVRKGDFR